MQLGWADVNCQSDWKRAPTMRMESGQLKLTPLPAEKIRQNRTDDQIKNDSSLPRTQASTASMDMNMYEWA